MWTRALPLCLLLAAPLGAGEPPTVGMPARRSVVLPGPRLVARRLDNRQAPLVLHIARVEPAEGGFRYDIEWTGMVPGRFDLGDYLRRGDGSPATGLPAVPVTVQSILPPGQTVPNPLGAPAPPRLGGYRTAVLAGAVLWGVGLVALVRAAWPRRRRKAAVQPPSLADHLRPLIEEALAGRADPARLAELERWLLGYWSRKLGVAAERPTDALVQLRRHAVAGPLLGQLESWLHSRVRQGRIDVNQLLAPYRDLPASALEDERP